MGIQRECWSIVHLHFITPRDRGRCWSNPSPLNFTVPLYERPVLLRLQSWAYGEQVEEDSYVIIGTVPSLQTDQSDHRDNIWLTGQRCALPFIDIHRTIYRKLRIL